MRPLCQQPSWGPIVKQGKIFQLYKIWLNTQAIGHLTPNYLGVYPADGLPDVGVDGGDRLVAAKTKRGHAYHPPTKVNIYFNPECKGERLDIKLLLSLKTKKGRFIRRFLSIRCKLHADPFAYPPWIGHIIISTKSYVPSKMKNSYDFFSDFFPLSFYYTNLTKNASNE